MARLVCDTCGQGPLKGDGGVSVYRSKQPGDNGAWYCREHTGPMLDEDILAIVRAIENGNRTERTDDDDA